VYARSTTIQAQPSSIDAGVAHMRDVVLPRLQEVDGCVGLSVLADKQTGRCIATTAWETEDAMRAREEEGRPVRDRAMQVIDVVGSPVTEEWEIAALHREHRAGEGACARVIWVKMPPDQLDAGINFYKMSVLPDLEALDGFCSASLLVDRASGHAVTCTSFDSLEAMERSREQATALKNTKILEVGAEELDDGEFELRLAHLRAPELV
jgi:hypothetical protein